MAKRPPLPKYSTPLGIFRYPHLNKADTRFDAEGVFKVDVRVPMDDAADLIAFLEGLRDAKYDGLSKKDQKVYSKADVFEVELDDEGEETGFAVFKTKLPAVGHNKESGESWSQEPKLFDSQGNPLPSEAQIWSGSKGIVAGTVSVYAMGSTKMVGVSLKCRGVQVIELVSGGGQTAESFGFGAHSGGYVSEPAKAGIGANEESSDDGSDEDGDDGEF